MHKLDNELTSEDDSFLEFHWFGLVGWLVGFGLNDAIKEWQLGEAIG